MKIRRQSLSDLDSSIIEKLAYRSLFGSPGFAKIWETVGGHVVFWTAEEDGQQVGVLPGLEFGWFPFKRFQSMPDGCYTCLAGNFVDETIRASVANEILAGILKAGYVKVHINDFHKLFDTNKRVDTVTYRTSLVDISSPDWQPPDKKIQSEIRKAERENVVVQRFVSAEQMDRFLLLMKQSEQGHGRKPKYPRRFFEALAKLAESDRRVRWFTVEIGDEIACSHIDFVEGEMLLNWQVYFDRRFSSHKPNQLLLYRAAREAAGEGINRLNLGSSPSDAEGLLDYKRKWGGREVSYPCLIHKSGIGKFY